MLVGLQNTLLGALAVMDPIKPEARGVVASLHHLGMQCMMVTGDNWRTARAIADQLGIINVVAEVLPAGKVSKIKVIVLTMSVQARTPRQADVHKSNEH